MSMIRKLLVSCDVITTHTLTLSHSHTHSHTHQGLCMPVVALLCRVLTQVSAASEPRTLSDAAAARADAAAAAAASQPSSLSGSTISSTPHGDSNTPGGQSHRHTTARSTAEGSGVVLDKVAWWGDVAREAYEAMDGCLQGFEDAGEGKPLDTASAMSGSEAEMVKVSVDAVSMP